MNLRQCFEILELDTDATMDDLNRAYKDLVTVWHPDRFSANPRLKKKAEEKLKKVNQAYDRVLSFLSSEETPQDIDHNNRTPSSGISPSKDTTRGTAKNRFHWKRKTKPDFQLRPWVRFFARAIDYLLFAFFLRLIGADAILPETEIRALIIPILIAFAWIIPEASLLTLFGATPGKWVLRTAVVDIFQLKPKFSSALRRSLSVWCNGMGMGVFFIAPITALVAWYRTKISGCTIWDRDGRFSVKHGNIGAPRIGMACFSSAVIIYFLILGPNIMIEACRQIVRIKPDDPKTRLNLGDSYAEAGRFNEEIEAYTHAIKIRPDYAQAHYNLGQCYLELERYDEALAPFKKAIALRPDDPDVLYGLGVCYGKLGLAGEAVEAFKATIKIKPVHAQAFHELGVHYAELKRYDEAIEASKKAIKIRPDYAPTHYNLGVCYSKLHRTEKAIDSFKTAVRINPGYGKGYYSLGLCYVDLGRYDNALEPFKKASELEPDDAEIFYGMGVCYAKLRLTHKAVSALKQAIKIKPDHAQAYHILGLSYLTLGKKSEALEQYERLQDLDTGLAEELRDYIENMPTSDEI